MQGTLLIRLNVTNCASSHCYNNHASLIAITSSVVRAENNVRNLPDRLSPGGVVRSGYENKVGMATFVLVITAITITFSGH